MADHVEMHRAAMERALQQAAVRWLDNAGRAVVNQARNNCPVDEGRLRASISHTVTVSNGRAQLRVGSGLDYARWQHEGTGIYGPHRSPIVPVTAKALKFRAGKMMGPLPVGVRNKPRNKRGFVFAKSVKGTPPSPFLADALKTVFGSAVTRDNTTT